MAFLRHRLDRVAAILRGERFDAVEIDPRTARFRDPSRERAFAKIHFSEHALSTLFYTLTGLVAYLGFGILDVIYMPGDWHLVLTIRVGTSLILFGFISAWFLFGSRLGYHLLPPIAMAVAGLGIVAMVAVMPAPKHETYYAGLLLVAIFFCNMPLLRFNHALGVTVSLIGAYVIVATLVNPMPGPVLLNNIFFTVSLTSWCLWINYWHQLYARQDFSHTRKLRDEAAKSSALFHEAAAANRAKSEFLAVMSHELRTPLNAILGFSDMMRSGIQGPIENETYKDYLEHIHDSGAHLLRLINDILDLSKADAGRLEVNDEPVDLVAVLTAVSEMISPLAEQDNVELIIEVPLLLPPVRGDERMLRQVFINLMSNAVKFTPEGGQVALRAIHEDSGELCIRVTDTGIGIEPEDIPRVLEPFVQVDSSLNRRYEGTGLGLPLAKKLVEAHEGTLEIDSAPGEGTRIQITLPEDRVLEDAPLPRAAAL